MFRQHHSNQLRQHTRCLVVVLLVMLLITSCEKKFIYAVHTMNPDQKNIVGAKVTIQIQGRAPLVEFTDNNGFVSFKLDDTYVDQFGTVTVESTGFDSHTESINLTRDALPKEIHLNTNNTPPTHTPTATVPPTLTPTLSPRGRLEGVLTDRNGAPLTDVSIRISLPNDSTGANTVPTDNQGHFILPNAPSGEQTLLVSISKTETVNQLVRIEQQQTTRVNLIYDSSSSSLRIALFSVSSPIDNGVLDVQKNGDEHLAIIKGRCDGISQIFGSFDVWLVIHPVRDPTYWVQHPKAAVDITTCTWQARAQLGDAKNPPHNGEQWSIMVFVLPPDSEIKTIASTTDLNLLPRPMTSIVVNATIQIQQ
jgi:hypothetical protein